MHLIFENIIIMAAVLLWVGVRRDLYDKFFMTSLGARWMILVRAPSSIFSSDRDFIGVVGHVTPL